MSFCHSIRHVGFDLTNRFCKRFNSIKASSGYTGIKPKIISDCIKNVGYHISPKYGSVWLFAVESDARIAGWADDVMTFIDNMVDILFDNDISKATEN